MERLIYCSCSIETGVSGLVPETFPGPHPLERREMLFWNTDAHCSQHLSLFSDGKLIPKPGN